MELRRKSSKEVYEVDRFAYDKGTGFTITLRDAKGRLWRYSLIDLMTQFEIVTTQPEPEKTKTVFDLKDGDECWAIYYNDDAQGGAIAHKVHWHEAEWKSAMAMGQIFLTQSECNQAISKTLAKEILKQDTKGFKPSESNDYESWSVYWDKLSAIGELQISRNYGIDGTLAFATAEDAEASIKAHPNEWKTYLGVEE